MKISFLAIKVTPKGRLVPAVVGQPNDHIMDWRGCNFRVLNLPGWKRGKTLENTEENRILLHCLLESVIREKLADIVAHYQGAGLGEHNYPFVDLTQEERREINRRKSLCS